MTPTNLRPLLLRPERVEWRDIKRRLRPYAFIAAIFAFYAFRESLTVVVREWSRL